MNFQIRICFRKQKNVTFYAPSAKSADGETWYEYYQNSQRYHHSPDNSPFRNLVQIVRVVHDNHVNSHPHKYNSEHSTRYHQNVNNEILAELTARTSPHDKSNFGNIYSSCSKLVFCFHSGKQKQSVVNFFSHDESFWSCDKLLLAIKENFDVYFRVNKISWSSFLRAHVLIVLCIFVNYIQMARVTYWANKLCRFLWMRKRWKNGNSRTSHELFRNCLLLWGLIDFNQLIMFIS